MEFLIIFLILFGVGAFLGLVYVGIVATFRTARGTVWFAKGMGRSMKEDWQRGVEKQKAIDAARTARE